MRTPILSRLPGQEPIAYLNEGLTIPASHAWDADAGTLHNDAWPLQMIFHSYDPIMAITDDTDNVWYVLGPFRLTCFWLEEGRY